MLNYSEGSHVQAEFPKTVIVRVGSSSLASAF